MDREAFQTWTAGHIRLLDGATGSNLRAAGMPAGVCSETWVRAHPETLQTLQRAYVDAGSEIILAPTFGANRALLAHHGLEHEVEPLNRALVALSAKRRTGMSAASCRSTGTAITTTTPTTARVRSLAEAIRAPTMPISMKVPRPSRSMTPGASRRSVLATSRASSSPLPIPPPQTSSL